MRTRLARLGVDGVEARTFHSAALAQLRRRAARPGPDPLHEGAPPAPDRQTRCLPRIASGPPATSRPSRVGEEPAADPRHLSRRPRRATSRRSRRPDGRVFREYERRKADSGSIDFEDLLEFAVRLYEADGQALAALRERYRAFTVDEYQDVNLLQQSLLELWLGDRDDSARRRRLPVDLRLHGCLARVAARAGRALSAGDRRAAGGELPLEAAGSRAREPARARARRRGEDASCDAAGRAGTACCGFDSPEEEGRSCWSGCGRSQPKACPSRRWPS